MFPPLAKQTYTAHILHITHQRMGNKSRQGVNCWVFWNIYQSHCQHLPRARWIREVLGEYTTLGKELTLRHKQNNHKHEAWWYHRILFCLDLKKRWHGIPSKKEVRESKSLAECSWWNGPTLCCLVVPRGSLHRIWSKKQFPMELILLFWLFPLLPNPPNRRPYNTAKFLV